MKKTRNFLAGLMIGALVVVSPMAMTGCAAIQGVFQSDPLGSSLFTLKSTYESSVRTAGRLYVLRHISEAQLRSFRTEAIKFHKAYTELVTLHELGLLKDGDVRVEQLSLVLDVLVAMTAVFSAQEVK